MKKKRNFIDCVYDMPENINEAFMKANDGMVEYGNDSLVNWQIDTLNDKKNKTRMKVHNWLIKEGYKDFDYVDIKMWW